MLTRRRLMAGFEMADRAGEGVAADRDPPRSGVRLQPAARAVGSTGRCPPSWRRWRRRGGGNGVVAVLVLLSHHGNDLHDRSSLIWPSTCSGTAAGDLAQGYLDRIEFGRARPYQPTRLHEGAARSSVVC